MYKRLADEGGVIDAIEASPLKGKVKFVWFNLIQPWHPQSTMLHEASLAVKKLDATKFDAFCGLLFDRQPEFVDKVTFDKSRKQIIQELAAIGAEAGVDAVHFVGFNHMNLIWRVLSRIHRTLALVLCTTRMRMPKAYCVPIAPGVLLSNNAVLFAKMSRKRWRC